MAAENIWFYSGTGDDVVRHELSVSSQTDWSWAKSDKKCLTSGEDFHTLCSHSLKNMSLGRITMTAHHDRCVLWQQIKLSFFSQLEPQKKKLTCLPQVNSLSDSGSKEEAIRWGTQTGDQTWTHNLLLQLILLDKQKVNCVIILQYTHLLYVLSIFHLINFHIQFFTSTQGVKRAYTCKTSRFFE